MTRIAAMMRLAPALAGLALLGGCATYGYGGYWSSGYPAYTGYVYGDRYRYRNPDGLIVAYDPGPSLYAVVSFSNLYWGDGYYYRRHGPHWERSRHHRGPWAIYRHGPPRVSVRHEPPRRGAPARPVAPPPRGERFVRPPGNNAVGGNSGRVQRRVERPGVPSGGPVWRGPDRNRPQPRSGIPVQTRGDVRPGGIRSRPDARGRSQPAPVNRGADEVNRGYTPRQRPSVQQAGNGAPLPGGWSRNPRSSSADKRSDGPWVTAPATDTGSDWQQTARPQENRRATPARRRDGARSGQRGVAPAPYQGAGRWPVQGRAGQPDGGRPTTF